MRTRVTRATATVLAVVVLLSTLNRSTTERVLAQNALPPKADPLPSWKEGKAKNAILDFVKKTTAEGSPDFVAPADRIAVFDNDGTLWPENPVPFEVAFSLDTAKFMMEKKPELKEKPAYKALANGDIAALKDNHLKLLLQLVVDTHAGQTTEQFNKTVADWIATAKHPRFGRLYSTCTYHPMQEVLRHLRANDYKTYIVSGGGQDFMRVWAEKVYGIPPEQVVGSVFKTKYELKDDKPTLTILPEIALIDDKAGKPVAIHTFIGKTPVMCFGNSDGDQEMLELTTIGRKPSFGLIVHHTDAEREYAYDAKPKSSGKLVEALAAAPKRGWVIVDMKNDWANVFSVSK
jgi:phosphoserine phosphatase